MNDFNGQSFSPKELAAVIGVSQSSIKRWVDAGHIPVSRTAGGHRRISRSAALQFIRSRRVRVVRPDLLGLPDLSDVRQPLEPGSLSGEFVHGLLVAGKVGEVRRVVTAAFLAGATAADLFDGPIVEALNRVGELWKTDQRGVYIEHSATSVIIEVVSQLAALIGVPGDDAPLALGAAPLNDPHVIPCQMVSTVLLEAGWRTVNMGPHTPVHAIADAAEAHTPELVWLALKSRLDARSIDELAELCGQLVAREITVVVGGREAERTRSAWPSDVHLIETLSGLLQFAGELKENRVLPNSSA